MELARQLKALCKERNISMNKLAKKAGVAPATLHGWSQGRSVTNLDDLRAVAGVLKTSLHELLFASPDPNEAKGEEILRELFSGDVRVTLHRIESAEFRLNRPTRFRSSRTT